ncbi:hypothetical protein [Vibrio crassostreae]|uniref:hypothetical protein n=1 Tax=Vibrio crassostreae TaxID=246167 RepID=UPI000F4846C6|nr:hypothetical protein [Vibrio crassostreae]ROO74365.1 hypothetical protein EDB57_0796 [Vibrio crassostreae]
MKKLIILVALTAASFTALGDQQTDLMVAGTGTACVAFYNGGEDPESAKEAARVATDAVMRSDITRAQQEQMTVAVANQFTSMTPQQVFAVCEDLITVY